MKRGKRAKTKRRITFYRGNFAIGMTPIDKPAGTVVWITEVNRDNPFNIRNHERFSARIETRGGREWTRCAESDLEQ